MHEDLHCGSAAGGLHCGATQVDQFAKSFHTPPSFAACGHGASLLPLSALCVVLNLQLADSVPFTLQKICLFRSEKHVTRS